MIDIQYVYDKEGKQVGVIVPIEMWTKISPLIKELKEKKAEWDPLKYEGIYKDRKINEEEEIKTMRDEWSRYE
jgi:hypothetical protein